MDNIQPTLCSMLQNQTHNYLLWHQKHLVKKVSKYSKPSPRDTLTSLLMMCGTQFPLAHKSHLKSSKISKCRKSILRKFTVPFVCIKAVLVIFCPLFSAARNTRYGKMKPKLSPSQNERLLKKLSLNAASGTKGLKAVFGKERSILTRPTLKTKVYTGAEHTHLIAVSTPKVVAFFRL